MVECEHGCGLFLLRQRRKAYDLDTYMRLIVMIDAIDDTSADVDHIITMPCPYNHSVREGH